jgi:hypothetical protein
MHTHDLFESLGDGSFHFVLWKRREAVGRFTRKPLRAAVGMLRARQIWLGELTLALVNYRILEYSEIETASRGKSSTEMVD